jgi:NitT/TauT family transport system substrate-binding protein
MMRFLGALLLANALLPAQAARAEKITIMVGGIEKQIYLPAKLAEQLGYFKEQGLEVELLTEPAGVQAENAMLAGEVQAVVGFYDHSIDLQSKGKLVESIVQFSQAPGEVELVSSKVADKVHSPADFKGKHLGVTGLGSSTSFLTSYLAVKNGVKIGEFVLVPVGAGSTFIAAIQQGKIDAGMTTEPTISRLLKTGEAKVLVDLRSPDKTRAALGGPYPAACLYAQTSWVDKHKDAAQKLANAFVKTLHYIHDNKAADIAEKMPRDYYTGDKDLYVRALADGKDMFTEDGVMPAQGPETVLQILTASNKALESKKIDLSKTYTTEFVKAVK